MAYLDLVADILQRVADRCTGIPEETLRAVEMDARADWGGERHYVAKVGEGGREVLAKRNAAIRDAFSRGAPEDYLSLRHGLCIKRIRQIVAGCVVARAGGEAVA